jgi:excisionase family DNA binding protein
MSSAAKPGRLTLTVEEAAKVLGIGRGLAYEGVRSGAIPSVRIGRRVVVPVAALRELLTNTEERQTGERGQTSSSPDREPSAPMRLINANGVLSLTPDG